MNLPKNFDGLLSQFGIERKSLLKLRFGGVIGKQALMGISTVAGIAIVAIKTDNPILLWGCLGAMVFSCSLVVVLNAYHAHKHPNESIMEGSEIVLLQHLRNEMAAKGTKAIPPAENVLEGIGTKKPLKEPKED
jgi:hypothetical protein